jgi:hypothetical protein
MVLGAAVLLRCGATVEDTLLLLGIHMRESGEAAILSGGVFFQKFFEGFSEHTLGISRPTVFPPAVTRLFFSVLLYLMKFTEQARFDNH